MSRENVEIARTANERFNRDGWFPEELFDPEVEFSNLAESPLPGPYRGHEGLRQWRRDLFEVVEDGHFETWDFTDVDEADAVMFKMRLRGHTRHTRIDVDISWTSVNWFRNGRIQRSAAYTDHAEALEAVGLSEQAMSQENVEVVQRAFEAFNRRDLSGMEGVFSERGEWRPLLTAGGELERPVYRGADGMAKYWADLDELFEDTEMHIDTLEPVDPSHVLFTGRVTAHGRKSGVPLDVPIWAVYEVHQGQLVRGTAYRSRDEALEAVGLSE